MPIDRSRLLRLGAEALISELESQIAELRKIAGKGEAGRRGAAQKGGRRGWTAAQRKAAAKRMRKYWAGRRNKKSKKEK